MYLYRSVALLTNVSSRFQALLKTYEQLAELIVDTVRLDIRSRVMFYLDSAMRFVSLVEYLSMICTQ